ncbi:MAG: DUF2278 family protein [Pseudonocardiaceae bacterium]
MPIKQYGLLAARAVARRRKGGSDTPHYQIHVVDNHGTAYRAAVNVQSQQAPSDLLFLADDDFRHPVTGLLPGEPSGWTPLPSQPGGASLDYIRANLFDPAALRPLPPDLPGADNDLADRLDHYVARAIDDPGALVYLFGQRWGPEPGRADKVFGFQPGNGVHDIHMNQGNTGRFREDDGVWQDGGLVLRFARDPRWVAIFLAFQSQAWHTDDRTGHAIDVPRPTGPDVPVRIIAALINPAGPAPEAETVTVLNASPQPIDLAGWRIADRLKHSCPLPPGPLAAGAVLTVPVCDAVQLGNHGGALTLLDPAGLKVHGVSYTAQQASRESWTTVF